MGAGQSNLDGRQLLERKMSTVSTSPATSVVTSAVTQIKRSVNWTVQGANSNVRSGFSSSPTYERDDDRERADQASKYALQVGDLNSAVRCMFPSIVQAQEMTTTQLAAPRIPFGLPTNFSIAGIGGHAAPIKSLAATADGSQVAVILHDKRTCAVIESATGNLVMSISGGDSLLSCAVSRDSKFVVTTGRDGVYVYDLNNGKRVREIPVPLQAVVITVTDDSDAILTALSDGSIHVWDGKGSEELLLFSEHTATISAVGTSRKGQLVASASSAGELLVWNYSTGQTRFSLQWHKQSICGVSFSSDGSRLCSADRDNVVVWDLFTGTVVCVRNIKGDVSLGPTSQPFREGPSRVTCCCFIGANGILVGTAKQVVLFEPNTGGELLSLPMKGIACAVTQNWNGDTVFIGDSLGNVQKLHLTFGARDVTVFNLNSKPTTQEKSKYD